MHIYTKGHTRERFRARLKKKKNFPDDAFKQQNDQSISTTTKLEIKKKINKNKR